MAIQELQRLIGELKELSDLLKNETKTQARWLIMQRIQEISLLIRKAEGS